MNPTHARRINHVVLALGLVAIAMAVGVAVLAGWLTLEAGQSEHGPSLGGFEYVIAIVWAAWAAAGAALGGGAIATRGRRPRLSLGLALSGFVLTAILAVPLATLPWAH